MRDLKCKGEEKNKKWMCVAVHMTLFNPFCPQIYPLSNFSKFCISYINRGSFLPSFHFLFPNYIVMED